MINDDGQPIKSAGHLVPVPAKYQHEIEVRLASETHPTNVGRSVAEFGVISGLGSVRRL